MDWDWSNQPTRLDPRRGYSLCRSCWNGNHFNKPFRDKDGVHHPKTSNCLLSRFKQQGDCGCGCLEPAPKKIKFTGAGQNELFDKSVQPKHTDE